MESEKKSRSDRCERPIVKGGKKHKVTFADYVKGGPKLTTIHMVESYKEHNVLEQEGRPTYNCILL